VGDGEDIVEIEGGRRKRTSITLALLGKKYS